MSDSVNAQVAPYPEILADLVRRLRYRQHLGWEVNLVEDYQRDKPGRHTGESRGLTLIVTRSGTNTYDPSQPMNVNHLFPVPPATYNEASWTRWLFDTLGLVDLHERMEDFAFAYPPISHDGCAGPDCAYCGPDSPRDWERPFKPNHGPGEDPYRVTELTSDEARRTSFRGDVNPA